MQSAQLKKQATYAPERVGHGVGLVSEEAQRAAGIVRRGPKLPMLCRSYMSHVFMARLEATPPMTSMSAFFKVGWCASTLLSK